VSSDIVRNLPGFRLLDCVVRMRISGLRGGKGDSNLLGMLAGRSWDSWSEEYSGSHQHPLNRLTHTFGIPIIMLSVPVLVASIVWHKLLLMGIDLFVAGWTLQFIGHAIEGEPPEFLKDWRFLLVGSRWWLAKMRGKA
jgi:uncharacterized membrane protein YGL010W